MSPVRSVGVCSVRFRCVPCSKFRCPQFKVSMCSQSEISVCSQFQVSCCFVSPVWGLFPSLRFREFGNFHFLCGVYTHVCLCYSLLSFFSLFFSFHFLLIFCIFIFSPSFFSLFLLTLAAGAVMDCFWSAEVSGTHLTETVSAVESLSLSLYTRDFYWIPRQ